MTSEMKGIVRKVFPTKKVGAKGFSKREFWVEEISDGEWKNIVPFVLKKDKCSLGDSLREGEEVAVRFAVDGHVWDKRDGTPPRCFCDLVCISVERFGSHSVPPPADDPPQAAGGAADDFDMPF